MIMAALMTAAVLLGVQLLVLGYIIQKKTKERRFEEKVEHLFSKNLSAYLSYITGEQTYEPRLPKSQALKREVLERLLNEVGGKTSDPDQHARIQDIAELHLSEVYRRSLLKDKWADRVNTLYFIQDFHMKNLNDAVWEHLQKLEHNDEEYRQALRVLAGFQDERVVDFLLYEDRLSFGFAKELIRRVSTDSLRRLAERSGESREDVPAVLEEAFVIHCGEAGLYEFLPFVESKLEDDRLEMRIKAFKSLCNYQYISDPSVMPSFFNSSYWEERMYAARLAGIMNLEEFIDFLKHLAGDNVWWVRFAACEAIGMFNDGESVLRDMAENHEDGYARDMALQTLTMKGGTGPCGIMFQRSWSSSPT
ncbi:HEAT repeat domain-containing protein [Salisediminibacterium selenitireducens]|uniref:HEAT domain containing protein n=1 Tax=Bacillus selenitireducens (strain ATCC 700615 / DSM 15326 / MLS10) TaxID=439292 RepID=D6XYF9_BACIE|nr:HEAT repeat domain-containing protein [Salisediminibacterium selenitireducens]ADI00228.1 HEAT domain containing protein [[Bacillus] selenitireducens MLS10]